MLGYWDPFADLNAAQDRWLNLNARNDRAFRPAVDIFEQGDDVHIDVELPGIKPEEIKVNVEGDVLTISGERKRQDVAKKEGYQRVERTYGTFTRAFSLGQDVDPESVDAKFDNGVLRLSLHKRAASKRREIAVKAA
ncbi:MAG TPA: Hsp20/alpha crystallin family protein [Polyangiales bacterium]|nr:Hsp20/alpha crystallin family protein [Polyangiales bacterium]